MVNVFVGHSNNNDNKIYLAGRQPCPLVVFRLVLGEKKSKKVKKNTKNPNF